MNDINEINDYVVEYLNSNRNIVINIDANNLVDLALKSYKFIKLHIEQEYKTTLITPDISLNTNQIKYLQLNLSWSRFEHHLDIEIIDGRNNAFVYYKNQSNKKKIEKWFTLDESLPNWLIKLLLLFTY